MKAKITHRTFKPYGEYDEFAFFPDTIHEAEIDGVKYLTDKHIIIRADFVGTIPDALMASPNPNTAKSIAEFIEKAFKQTPVAAPDRLLAPVYVAHLGDAGFDLVPSERLWLIQAGGRTVGAVAPLNDSTKQGIVPGGITPAIRAVHKIVSREVDNEWRAWQIAAESVEAVRNIK